MKNLNIRKYFKFFILFLLLITISSGLLFVMNRNSVKNKITEDNLADKNQSESKIKKIVDVLFEENPTIFTHDIFDTNLIRNITPLGELNGGGEEASAINGVMMNIKLVGSKAIKNMEIYAPTDMKLNHYAYTEYKGEPATWTLTFTINEHVTMRIDHVNMASKEIVEATTNKPTINDSTDKYPKKELKLKAGEIIGYTTGTSKAHNWNIYMYDTRNENTFVNIERYRESGFSNPFLNSVCPFDYYPSQMKKKYIKLMGYESAGQSKDCGEPSHDVRGTLSGMWHLSEKGVSTNYKGPYSSPISIYKNSANDITLAEFNKTIFTIDKANSTYKVPEEIRKEHCYELIDRYSQVDKGYVYFKIVSDTKMNVAYIPSGNCPSKFPNSNTTTYYR